MSNNKSVSLLKDFLGILALGLSVFVLISLISWSPQDSSVDQSGSPIMEAHNRGGVIGAYIGGGLARLFGAGAFIFPILTLLAGWALIRREEVSRWRIILSFGLVFLVGLCALLAVQLPFDPYFGAAVQSGGLIGARSGEALALWLNIQGARVFLGTIILISAQAMVGISANSMIEFSRRSAEIGESNSRWNAISRAPLLLT